MSATTPLPDVQDATNHLFSTVRANVFFTKLAQYGRQPANEKEAQEFLETAARLRVLEEHNAQSKQAASTHYLSQANASLANIMQQAGVSGGYQKQAQESDVAFQRYADQLAADPDIYNSVLAIKQSQADAVSQQLGY